MLTSVERRVAGGGGWLSHLQPPQRLGPILKPRITRRHHSVSYDGSVRIRPREFIVCVRLTEAERLDLDAYAAMIRRRTGESFTRSDAIRSALASAILLADHAVL